MAKDNEVITDDVTQDIIKKVMLVYRGSLEIARDVFGAKNMTEDVMRAAIGEAGSMVYRVLTYLEDVSAEPTDTIIVGDDE